MKPLGGKPKREYEMSEKERLLNQLRKANNEAENAKAQLNHTAHELQQMRQTAQDYYKDHRMIQFLMGQEVIIATDEGMKYLKGLDLVNYCKEKLAERAANLSSWDLREPLSFTKHANQAINEIIRDEVDKLSHTLDAYKYITKGRAIYDARSESQEEGS